MQADSNEGKERNGSDQSSIFFIFIFTAVMSTYVAVEYK